MADGEEDDIQEGEEQVLVQEDEPEENAAYECVTVVDEEEGKTITVEEQIEADIVSCFLCAGKDLSDPAWAEEASSCFHDELFGFYSRESAKQNGISVQKRLHSFKPKSELTIEERKKCVSKAKQNSSCRSCGQPGHWAGDQECKMKGGSTQGPQAPKSSSWQKRPHKFHDVNKRHNGRPVGYAAVVSYYIGDVDGEEEEEVVEWNPDSEPELTIKPASLPELKKGKPPDSEPELNIASPDSVPELKIAKPNSRAKMKIAKPDSVPELSTPRPKVKIAKSDSSTELKIAKPDFTPELKITKSDSLLEQEASTSSAAIPGHNCGTLVIMDSADPDRIRSCDHCGDRCADVDACIGCDLYLCSRCSQRGITCMCVPELSTKNQETHFVGHICDPSDDSEGEVIVKTGMVAYYPTQGAAAASSSGILPDNASAAAPTRRRTETVEDEEMIIISTDDDDDELRIVGEPRPKPAAKAKTTATKPKGRGSKLTEDRKKLHQTTPPCEKCENFTRKGTNAFQQKKTCLDCGKVYTEKKEQTTPSVEYERCKHPPEHCNQSGSTKTTCRIYCEDCGYYIKEEKRLVPGKLNPGLIGAAQSGSKINLDIRPNPEFTTEEAVKAAQALLDMTKLHQDVS